MTTIICCREFLFKELCKSNNESAATIKPLLQRVRPIRARLTSGKDLTRGLKERLSARVALTLGFYRGISTPVNLHQLHPPPNSDGQQTGLPPLSLVQSTSPTTNVISRRWIRARPENWHIRLSVRARVIRYRTVCCSPVGRADTLV